MIDSSRYTEKAYVGSGGMASVYKAFDQKLRRHVAIKEMSEQFRDNEELRNLFLNEARKMALVRHQNVVQVYDIFEGEIPTIIMEHMSGGSLATRVGTGTLPADIVLNIVRQVGTGLRAIHDAGLVHRDIKPENILEEGGKYKITDFGVAVTGEEEALPFVTNKYAAPEVLLDPGKIGPSSDIYSLGVMAAELLLGPRRFEEAVREAIEQDSEIQLPAIRNSAQAFWQQWVASDAELPSLSKLDPSIPEEVSAFIAKVTRRDRKDRIPDSREFVTELDGVIAATGQRASAQTEYNPKIAKKTEKSKAAKAEPAAAKKKKQPLWFKLALVVGGLLLLAVGALFLVPGGPPRYFFDLASEPVGASVLVNGTAPDPAQTPTRVSAAFGDVLTFTLDDGEPREFVLATDMEGLTAGEEAYQLQVTLVEPLSIESSRQAAEWIGERQQAPWPVTARIAGIEPAEPLTLATGLPLVFEVASAQAGSLMMLHLSADNYASVIYPSPNGLSPQIRADETTTIGDELRLVTREPLGQEWMLFLVGTGLDTLPPIDGAIPVNDTMRAFKIDGAGSPGQALIVWLGEVLASPDVSGTLLAVEIVAPGDDAGAGP